MAFEEYPKPAPKDSYIHIRCGEDEKKLLKYRAAQLDMTMTEYLIHAGICYEPSDELKRKAQALNDLKDKAVGKL